MRLLSLLTAVLLIADGLLVAVLAMSSDTTAEYRYVLQELTYFALGMTLTTLIAWAIARLSTMIHAGLHRLVPQGRALLFGVLVASVLWRDPAAWLGIEVPSFLLNTVRSTLSLSSNRYFADSLPAGVDFPVGDSTVTADGVLAAQQVMHTSLQWARRQLIATDALLRDLPVLGFFGLLLTTLLLAQALSRDDGDPEARPRTLAWWKKLTAQQRSAWSLAGIAAVGVYLGVVAIVAIPRLVPDSEGTQTLSGEELTSRLDTITRISALDSVPISHSEGATKRFDATLRGLENARDSLTRLVSTIEESAFRRREFVSSLKRSIEYAVSRVGTVREDYEGVLRLHEARRQAHLRAIVAAKRRTLDEYESLRSIGGLASELAQRGAVLTRHLNERVLWLTEDIAQMRRDVTESERGIELWLTLLEQAQKEDLTAVSDTTNPAAWGLQPRLDSHISWSPSFSRRSWAYEGEFWLPTSSPPGSELGVFGVFASWLLSTRSLAIVQLVGMLGFGMFGAVLAALRVTRSEGDAALGVPATLLAAFSATLVIFLAVNAGLAVVADGEAQPNSYLLLLACFVASTSNKDVWAWARRWFNGQFGGADSPQGSRDVDAAETPRNATTSTPGPETPRGSQPSE